MCRDVFSVVVHSIEVICSSASVVLGPGGTQPHHWSKPERRQINSIETAISWEYGKPFRKFGTSSWISRCSLFGENSQSYRSPRRSLHFHRLRPTHREVRRPIDISPGVTKVQLCKEFFENSLHRELSTVLIKRWLWNKEGKKALIFK